MGHGGFSADVFASAVTARKQKGVDDFDYSRRAARGEVDKVHEYLDPLKIKGVRESRDSADHPVSVAMVLACDTTGSMRENPVRIQRQLAHLHDQVITGTRIKHPQFLMMSIGDVTSDRYPVQVGQFESDNRFDEQLRQMILEGNGGAYGQESYDMFFYFLARKTSIDCYEKRGQKGIAILIADELPREYVAERYVNAIFGDQLVADIPIREIIAEAQQKYEIFLLMPQNLGTAASNRTRWESLLGKQYVSSFQTPDHICETIVDVIRERFVLVSDQQGQPSQQADGGRVGQGPPPLPSARGTEEV